MVKTSSDTAKLLKECNSGIKMGVSSIDDVLSRVESGGLKRILEQSKEEHSILGDETHKLLCSYDLVDKEPNPMAKAMSWTKTNVKLTLNEDDKTIADIMTQGCNMGIKSLNKYLNEYSDADEEVKKLTKKVIAEEEHLVEQLKKYL